MREERTSRHALTLLFAGVVFLILIAVSLVIFGLMLLLQKTGAIAELAENVFSNTTLLAIFLAGISLIVGAGLTLFLSRILMRPMNQIIEAMHRVAAGDYHTRLDLNRPLSHHPTIRLLQESFNTMSEELERTEILRSDFINNFSHEFKTPIVSIAGFAKLLKRDTLSEAQKKEYLDIIEEESLRLSAMATNVLNLTKVENQVILTDVTSYNLSEQLRSCVLLLEKEWASKGLDWALDYPEVSISANEELLREVWINLLDNAIKFGDPGSTVSVELVEASDSVTVSIADTGSVIPPDRIVHVFRKFYQADESHASKGNGIGLALVKAIVDLHGGTIAVTSSEQATVFSVTLPR